MSFVAVVIPHFEQPHSLALVLAALERQTRRPDVVVVADDGSATSPDPGRRPFPVRVVRQEDRGVRPGAARNLGVASLVRRPDAIVFLDGDTVPTDEYVAEIAAPILAGRLDIAVGRRRHAHLSDLSPLEAEAVVRHLPASSLLPDPQWLADGYERTHDLTDGSHGVWRYVISAVVACSGEQFERIGGFDASIDTYGGEDWDFAFRAWVDGADFGHVPTAVAVHDGPDFAGRQDRADLKTDEAIVLAERIVDPSMRGRGILPVDADGHVMFRASGRSGADIACIDSLLATPWTSVRVEVTGHVDPRVRRCCAGDPRVTIADERHITEPCHRPPRWSMRVEQPCAFDHDEFERLVRPLAEGRGSTIEFRHDGRRVARIESARGTARQRRGRPVTADTQSLDASRSGCTPLDSVDLPRWFRDGVP